MATTTTTQQQGQQSAKRKSGLNMGIAATHQLTTQLVGIQLSGANLLAIGVSAASVVAEPFCSPCSVSRA